MGYPRTLRFGPSSVALLLVVSLLLAFSPPGTAAPSGFAAAYWKACSSKNIDPQNDLSLPLGSVKAHAMSCNAARKAIVDGTIKIHCCGEPGPATTQFHTPGFSCKGLDPVVCTGTGHRRRFQFGYGE